MEGQGVEVRSHYDISQFDFERFRREYEQRHGDKHNAIQNLRAVIERASCKGP